MVASSSPTARSVRWGVVLLLGLLPLLTACQDESLLTPEVTDARFQRYVALGNSITAGFQSGGISSETQSESYAVLLGEQMNTPFSVPRLKEPGCPPPFVNFFGENGIPDPQRPDEAPACALRTQKIPLRLNNVAVPGARVVDILSNQTSSANALTQLILGGRTQIEAALEITPTFATVWIGNNNVLGAARRGTDNATPVSDFEQRYGNVVDSLTTSPDFQGGVLIGVVDVVFAPFFSPGPAYLGLDQAGRFPPNFNVASNCGARDPAPRVPIDYGFGLIGQAVQNPEQTVTLNCEAQGKPVLTQDEVSTLGETVQQYNSFIQEQAQNHGLAYLNPNQVLGALYTNDDGDQDPTNDLIPKFPNQTSDQPFGRFFSLDGIHPSAVTHRLVAAQLVQVINEQYGTSLAPPENVPSLPTGSQ
ncbi:MAG: SGNH/GDSL hydrolase family protein [Salinibacter sp.]|uniref:SGNH/GDSL hydrolase family protein n=1 Tax=Salinibacter sp. TaxID=2065818 RepID=UPI0035D46983